MKILKKEVVFEGKFIRVIVKHFENKDGKKGIWEMVERKIPQKKAVIIFALTKDKEVVLERIYRIPLEAYVLETPAGLCDKKGESDVNTARRELLEETGYKAKTMIKVFETTGNMALTNTKLIYFFAPDVEFVGVPENRDDAEEIEVIMVPLEKLIDFALNPPKDTLIAYDLLSVVPILQKKGLIPIYGK